MKVRLFQLLILQFALTSICCSYAFEDIPAANFKYINRAKADSNDSLMAVKTIISFLRWYKTNLHKANSFPLLTKDSKGYYKVNKKACTGYLNFLNSSRLVAPKYLGYWQTFFHDKAAMLTREKIQSDIPEGFDMDFVLITQEPDIILNKIDKLKFDVISINKTVALIGVTLPADTTIQYEFEMYNSKEGWQIGYISTPNFD